MLGCVVGSAGQRMARGDEPREGVWSAAPRPIRPTSRKPPGWIRPLALAPILLNGVFSHHGPELFAWTDGVWLLIWVTVVAVLLHRKVCESLALRVTPSDLRFSDRPPGVEEFAMEIVIVNDEREIGADRGFMWFEGDLLHFNGAATSFTLGRQDIFPRRMIGGKDPYHDLPNNCIRLRIPGRPAIVRLMPLRGYSGRGFGFKLGMFVGKGRASVGDRQWPPLKRYREGEPVVHQWDSSLARVGDTMEAGERDLRSSHELA